MANFLAPIINGQQFDANGDPLSSGEIYVYLAGTSTPATTYTTQAGGTPNTFPIDLNTLGVNEDGEVWLIGGASYKFVIKDSAGVTLRTIDNVSGINDTAVTTDQWLLYQATPTYVSATSFTVAGDQTQTFQVNRRLKTQNTGGLVYSTITASSYLSPNTTVTVRNDSGTLDSGLSLVSYGLISVQNSSVTGLLLNQRYFTSTQVYTPTAGTTFIVATVVGGGGGGGAAQTTAAGQCAAGSGGAGGGWAKRRITSGFSGVTITIGAGGAGGTGGGGSAGGTTSVGALVSAAGGSGGLFGAAASAATVSVNGTALGGSGSGGDINGTGGFGTYAVYTVNPVSGAGGFSLMGSGAQYVSTATTIAGNIGPVFGAGGSGGANGASQGAGANGGAGATGVCIIEEYA